MSQDVAEQAIAKCRLMASKDEKLKCLKEALRSLGATGVRDAIVQRQVRTLEVAIVSTEGDLG